MIEVERISKNFGPIQAVRDVSFRVEAGEILGFLGPNGAGKTTTMRLLTGFYPPSKGVARVAGLDVLENPIEVRRKIGYLPENVPLYPEMTVRDFLDFVTEIKGVPRSDRLGE
ncbi:MAG: ATP-binding cassette domain-containing protein, partial [Thermodesulfobacteriota bacterium]